MQRLKYLAVYILPLSTIYAFNAIGIYTFLPIFFLFIVIPILELFLPVDTANFEERIAIDEKNESIYDWMLYLTVPIQVGTLIYFLFAIDQTPFGSLEFWTRIMAMGLMCGVVGINVGHELGHRKNKVERFLGDILMLTSLNTHFGAYHNGGHHLLVATPQDPATAAKNEWLYTFWFRSHFGGYLYAWKSENRMMRHQGRSIFSFKNKMIVYSILNIFLLGSISFFFGKVVLFAYLVSVVLGIGLLQTVNYIEHYGLMRKQREKGRYEPVGHQHSWNSDHPLGRMMLFNLSRHSDHHYNGSIKYQVLKSVPISPQMPTGYPGMMVLAFFQPLWFYVMNKKLEEVHVKINETQVLVKV